MATLEEIRAKLNAQKEKNSNNSRENSDNSVYPFWNIPDNSTAIVRFIPDGNPDNTFFWQERQIIKLPFAGIEGHNDRDTFVQVPCMHMFGKQDYIINETKPWWNDSDLESEARKYWKKRSYLFQGFVVENPDNFEDEAPRSMVRRFMMNPTIFKIIESSLLDPELEHSPVDFEGGRDFKINKTKKGQYANYETSSWSMKTRALTEEELDAVNEQSKDLREFMPNEPNEEELDVIKEMFSDSVEGLPYNPDKYSKYYKPMGFNPENNQDASVSESKSETETSTKEETKSDPLKKIREKASKAKEVSEGDDASSEEKPEKTEKNAQEILNLIRARSKTS